MAKCLGLYIEDNIIKYAKLSKDYDKIKIDSFGVKFYDDLNKAINQVVDETYSYKIPICTNLESEIYNYIDMFALLNQKDLNKAIKTEFELYCGEQGYNPNLFETRYAIANNIEDKQKLRVIHVAENRTELNKKIEQLRGYKLTNITPISMSIVNLMEPRPKENYLIVNIEQKTTITKVYDEKIYGVEILEIGSNDFLNKINLKENSYSKTYEICKNTTIYTNEGRELQEVETGYLEYIMPTLYEIAQRVKNIANEDSQKINKIYLTGTATLINNIDLYFQEYLSDIECEILKPYFIETTQDVSIKDYIEVNTAISLALSGLDEGIQGMNFKTLSIMEKLPDWLKIDNSKNSKLGENKFLNEIFKNNLGEKLDKIEINLVRGALSLSILLLLYCGFSYLLNIQMENKMKEADKSCEFTTAQIALVDKDNEKILSQTNRYTELIKNLQDINDRITDANKTRKVIPNLLNSIMSKIPEGVQITSIQNTTDTHIEIDAQSNQYDQLGFFKAVLQNNGILLNVISTAGEKENDVVKVKIEGDLP